MIDKNMECTGMEHDKARTEMSNGLKVSFNMKVLKKNVLIMLCNGSWQCFVLREA